jgi:phosphate transport system permease protein
MTLIKKRKLINNVALVLSLGAMSFGLFWLAWILVTILQLGVAGLSVAVFTQMTPPPGSAGGLANAIFGSVVMVGLATLIGTVPCSVTPPALSTTFYCLRRPS